MVFTQARDCSVASSDQYKTITHADLIAELLLSLFPGLQVWEADRAHIEINVLRSLWCSVWNMNTELQENCLKQSAESTQATRVCAVEILFPWLTNRCPSPIIARQQTTPSSRSATITMETTRYMPGQRCHCQSSLWNTMQGRLPTRYYVQFLCSDGNNEKFHFFLLLSVSFSLLCLLFCFFILVILLLCSLSIS